MCDLSSLPRPRDVLRPVAKIANITLNVAEDLGVYYERLTTKPLVLHHPSLFLKYTSQYLAMYNGNNSPAPP
jgi:hypothetical protein